MSNNVHWVEELFKPSFDVNEIYNEAISFQDRLDMHSVASIKNLYDRVLRSTNTDGHTTIEINKENTQCDEPKEADAPVWSKDELEILRETTHDVVAGNKKLQVQLQCYISENTDLNSDITGLRSELELIKGQHGETMKANKRLSLAVNSHRKDINSYKSENSDLRRQLECVIEDKRNIYNDCIKVKNKYGKLQVKSNRLILETQEFNTVLENEKQLLKDKLSSLYENKILGLRCELDKIRIELDSEKLTHSVTKKGLEQLRVHFAGMNCQDGTDRDLAFSLT